jgi:hypothetical protein
MLKKKFTFASPIHYRAPASKESPNREGRMRCLFGGLSRCCTFLYRKA